MGNAHDERQKRIDKIEAENKALKDLNDLKKLRQKIESEPALGDQVGVEDESEVPLRKIAKHLKSPSP